MANLFGTLNRFISRLDSDPNPNVSPSQTPLHNQTNHYGFQVLRNTNTTLQLDPWFDFIIGLNGHNISHPDPQLFITEIRNCAGSTISLGVYSAKGGQIREVYIAVPAVGESLGLALQWAPLQLAEDVWHILDVIPDSPADHAGLLPYSDYVIGSPDVGATASQAHLPPPQLRGDGGLGALVERFLDRPLRLFVYNQEYDVTRLVTLTPAKNWGGEGSLGCVLGYGALHRIPAPLTEPAQGPGETLFSSDDPAAYAPSTAAAGASVAALPAQGGGEFFVPAAAAMPPPSAAGGPPPSATGGKARKTRLQHPPSAGLDDYFAEGEQKSRELEGSSSTPKPTAGLPPPPPKAGGPPKAASLAPPPPSAAAATVEEGDDAAEA